MKYVVFCIAVLFIASGCCRREVVYVESRPPVKAEPCGCARAGHARSVAIETVSVERKPAPCHTIIGDTLKFTVLIVSDVVGIFVPVEEQRREILRTRLVEGW